MVACPVRLIGPRLVKERRYQTYASEGCGKLAARRPQTTIRYTG